MADTQDLRRRGPRKRGFVVTDAGGNPTVRPFTTSAEVLLGDGTTGAVPAGALPTHATTHQNGGSDEVNVGGLTGVLADAQLVDVDPAGALDGDSASTPLAVRVDGVTIEINGSNELEVIGGGGGAGSAWSVLTNGDPVAPELVWDSNGDVIMTEALR